MLRDYVKWIGSKYSQVHGIDGPDEQETGDVTRFLGMIATKLGQGKQEDFISLFTIEFAERLAALGDHTQQPFSEMVRTVTWTVRKRIQRESDRQRDLLSKTADLSLPTAESANEPIGKVIQNEILNNLRHEEQVAIAMLLDGARPLDVAQRLGVSMRTVARTIKAIQVKLQKSGGFSV